MSEKFFVSSRGGCCVLPWCVWGVGLMVFSAPVALFATPRFDPISTAYAGDGCPVGSVNTVAFEGGLRLEFSEMNASANAIKTCVTKTVFRYPKGVHLVSVLRRFQGSGAKLPGVEIFQITKLFGVDLRRVSYPGEGLFEIQERVNITNCENDPVFHEMKSVTASRFMADSQKPGSTELHSFEIDLSIINTRSCPP